jgi:hypothetical protein
MHRIQSKGIGAVPGGGHKAHTIVNGERLPGRRRHHADGIDDIFVELGIQNAPAVDEGQTTIDASTEPSTGSEGGGSGCFIRAAWP